MQLEVERKLIDLQVRISVERIFFVPFQQDLPDLFL